MNELSAEGHPRSAGSPWPSPLDSHVELARVLVGAVGNGTQ